MAPRPPSISRFTGGRNCRVPAVFQKAPVLLLGCLACWCSAPRVACSATNEPAKPDRWFFYTNDVNEDIPLSLHVIRIEHSHHDFEFCTTLGKGKAFGMEVVSDQVKSLPADCGQPLAAINGDFYDKNKTYPGRPRDVQIYLGEVVSSPAGHTSFWMSPDGVPHMT